jgi:hypothetical protein
MSEETKEVTRDELILAYGIRVLAQRETAWMREIQLKDHTGKTTRVILRWDEDYGYAFYLVDNDPELLRLSRRPEFEYILDSITCDPWARSYTGTITWEGRTE